MTVTSRETKSYDKYCEQEVRKIQSHYRAKKSRLIRNGTHQDKAISLAAKVIPQNFPEKRLPRDLRNLSIQTKNNDLPTDKEVKEYVANAIKRGEMTLVPKRQQTSAAQLPQQNSAAQLPQQNSAAQLPQQAFEPKGTLYILAIIVLYSLIIPTTASIFDSVIVRLDSPFPTTLISYALACIIDGVAISYVSYGFRHLRTKKGVYALAIASGIIMINAGGLYYKINSARPQRSAAIEEQENRTEKARLHWLASKWRAEADPVACERNPSSCGTPIIGPARSRQNKYQLEVKRLEKLTNVSTFDPDSLIHAGYFLLFWILLGLVAHLRSEAAHV